MCARSQCSVKPTVFKIYFLGFPFCSAKPHNNQQLIENILENLLKKGKKTCLKRSNRLYRNCRYNDLSILFGRFKISSLQNITGLEEGFSSFFLLLISLTKATKPIAELICIYVNVCSCEMMKSRPSDR